MFSLVLFNTVSLHDNSKLPWYSTSLHCLVYRYYNIVVNLFQLVYYSHYLKLTDSSCNFLGISTELATKQGH